MANLFINSDLGTRIAGSSFGRLELAPISEESFMHQSYATLHYEDGALFALIDPEIARYYRWIISRRLGVELCVTAPKIMLIQKGENYKSKNWGFNEGLVIEYRYGNQICTDAKKWWLNTYSKDFITPRTFYNLPREMRDEWFGSLIIGESPVDKQFE